MSDAMRNMSKKYQQSQLIDLSLPFSEKNPRIFRTKAMPHAIFNNFPIISQHTIYQLITQKIPATAQHLSRQKTTNGESKGSE